MQMQLRQKRQPSFNDKKEAEETPSSSTANTSTNNLDSSPHATPPPNKRMTWAAQMPVAQQKQPEPVKKQPMNVIDIMQDLAKTMENCNQLVANCNQLNKELDRIQKHDTNNFVITDEFVEKMKEFREKTSLLNASMPKTVNIQSIRKRIQLTIKNCRELLTKDKFWIESTSIELVGFEWILVATTKEKGYLGLYLQVDPPNGYNGNYRIEVDWRFSILNAFAFADKYLIKKERIGQVYTVNEGTAWGYSNMAKYEDLLDPNKTFLTPEGDMEICADFTINSSTLDHLT